MRYVYVLTLALLSIIFAAAPASAQQQYPNGYYAQPQGWHGALSSDDQQKFDEEYAKWVDSQRKNDQDDVAKHAGKMQEIMARHNIPSNVPYDAIAGNAAYAGPNPNGGYPVATYPYPTNAPRLSVDDQRKFDEEYAKWVNSERKNDRDDIAEHAAHMQEIMGRNGIPTNVPFAAIATNGYAAGVSAPAYGYAQPAPVRLSADDQKDFDKSYRKWVEARHKRDIDDIDKNARKMQQIMAKYNIPANVSFDQIASYRY